MKYLSSLNDCHFLKCYFYKIHGINKFVQINTFSHPISSPFTSPGPWGRPRGRPVAAEQPPGEAGTAVAGGSAGGRVPCASGHPTHPTPLGFVKVTQGTRKEGGGSPRTSEEGGGASRVPPPTRPDPLRLWVYGSQTRYEDQSLP